MCVAYGRKVVRYNVLLCTLLYSWNRGGFGKAAPVSKQTQAAIANDNANVGLPNIADPLSTIFGPTKARRQEILFVDEEKEICWKQVTQVTDFKLIKTQTNV